MKRRLDPDSLRALARGCAVLGAGGGGDPYLGLLQALQATEDFGPVALVDIDELPGESLIMPCGGIGAPTVSIEKIENGDEGGRLREHLEFVTGRRVTALMAAEIGGSNGLLPVAWAARMGLPLVDADGMGRAFPEVPQVTMHLAGISPSPAVMTDERGNLIVFQAISGHWIERLERAAAVEFGGAASSTEFSLTAAQARTATVRGSVSMAIRIGQAVTCAEGSPVAALIAEIGAFRLVTGSRPFPPPISPTMSAATFRPVCRSSCALSRSPSSPFSIFSRPTRGAPTPPHGMTSASSGSSSTSISMAGPKSAVACRACSRA